MANEASESDLEKNFVELVLMLEQMDKYLFRGTNLWSVPLSNAVFGGQIVAQALVAASKTAPESAIIHSCHCYFTRTGKTDRDITYSVENVLNGSSSFIREVKAVQADDVILSMLVSLHMGEESCTEHQFTMPHVPPPEALSTFKQKLKEHLRNPHTTSKARKAVEAILKSDRKGVEIDIKPVDMDKFFRTRDVWKVQPTAAKQMFWTRINDHLGNYNDNIHKCAVAYISDLAILGTTFLPLPEAKIKTMISLDHSIWFHTNIRVDEWMLFESEGPKLAGNRAFVVGRIWKRDGTLAASVAQEGIIRADVGSGL